MIARSRFVSGRTPLAKVRKLLSAHLKYMQHRNLGELERSEDRAIFTKDSDAIERSAALNTIMQQRGNRAHYHKLMLSPALDEPVIDMRDWTRRVMADLEERKGLALTWVAVQHHNTDYPHVHMVIAGSGIDQDGQMRQLRLDQADLAFVRERGREHSDREHYRELREMAHELDTREQSTSSGRQRPEEREQSRLLALFPGLRLSWRTGSASQQQQEEREDQQWRERDDYER